MIEFDFLTRVTEQELERVRDLNCDDRKTAEKLDQVATEISFEQQKCKQVLLRALSISLGTGATVNNALNASMHQANNVFLDEEDLLSEAELKEKRDTVNNLHYKAEKNLAVVNF